MENDADYVRLVVAEVKFVLLIRCENAGGILNLAHPAAASESTAEFQNKEIVTFHCDIKHDDTADCHRTDGNVQGLDSLSWSSWKKKKRLIFMFLLFMFKRIC